MSIILTPVFSRIFALGKTSVCIVGSKSPRSHWEHGILLAVRSLARGYQSDWPLGFDWTILVLIHSREPSNMPLGLWQIGFPSELWISSAASELPLASSVLLSLNPSSLHHCLLVDDLLMVISHYSFVRHVPEQTLGSSSNWCFQDHVTLWVNTVNVEKVQGRIHTKIFSGYNLISAKVHIVYSSKSENINWNNTPIDVCLSPCQHGSAVANFVISQFQGSTLNLGYSPERVSHVLTSHSAFILALLPGVLVSTTIVTRVKYSFIKYTHKISVYLFVFDQSTVKKKRISCNVNPKTIQIKILIKYQIYTLYGS